ncbi:hypothetical protein SAMN04487830_13032 [Pseudobutyrivibrio sp. OR37]|uniref:hypothetical protein n=1 Tax=Pseudobutyrivibrio sp. OR37 TaxID=1798186 RepID=UPI0008E26641|nr:hypothetical protein [Pseudobutyrivibrio sp. OR37]SFI20885.1 hypothetical protein SAMN04487830_13032 [Pseudobutyrivibrio sp. OR37]
MLGTIILITFSAALLAANIICFIKKKYLYLFVPCMLFLPEYYGVDLGNDFPIFTVARMMFIVFYLYAFINRRRSFTLKGRNIKSVPKEFLLIGGYFVFRIFSNLYYAGTYSQAVKTIFLIIFEQMLFLIAFYMLAPTKEEIDKLFLVIVRVATVFFIIGIFESVSFVRPFDSLYTVSRSVINEHYVRLGLLRATTTFGMPGLYANMCVLVLPIIIYIYNLYHKKRYLVSVWFCILALIHTGSRADFFYLPVIFLVYILVFIKDKQRLIPFIKHTAVILLSLLLFIGITCGGNPYFKYFYVGTGKSILNEVGFDFDLNEGAPEGVKGYGGNDKANGANQGGVGSRKVQLSGITYTLNTSPIFGLGSGALERKEVKYRVYDKWLSRPAIDVGIVEVVAYEGLLGLIGISLLLIALFMLARNNLTYLMLGLVYLLTTLNTVNMYSFLLLFVAIFMMDYKERTSLG